MDDVCLGKTGIKSKLCVCPCVLCFFFCHDSCHVTGPVACLVIFYVHRSSSSVRCLCCVNSSKALFCASRMT